MTLCVQSIRKEKNHDAQWRELLFNLTKIPGPGTPISFDTGTRLCGLNRTAFFLLRRIPFWYLNDQQLIETRKSLEVSAKEQSPNVSEWSVRMNSRDTFAATAAKSVLNE